MKFSVVLAFVAAATIVSADSNAGRFARGLGPMSPMRRGSKPDSAHHSKPSNTPGKCSSEQTQQCCKSVQKGSECDKDLLNGLGIVGLSPDILVGLSCIGGLGSECSQQNVCCKDNSYSGILAVDCNAINL